MLAARTRSGVVETVHDGALAAVDVDGNLVASCGDIDRPFYLRSAAKPFQAHVAQQMGADLSQVELAIASASHDGHPVQVAIVDGMLSDAGLGPEDLRCPPVWPLSTRAARSLVREGHEYRRRIWHNCSGKHASWLRACRAQGWSTGEYLRPDHPLQQRIVYSVSEYGGYSAGPVGVDGCGAPVLRTNARLMALLFARLASLSELRHVFTSMHRYPALVSGYENGDASIAIALNAVAKRGAAGCLGVAVDRRFGIGVKSWDGIGVVADVAAVAALGALGATTGTASDHLAVVGRPPTQGGERMVGAMEQRIELEWA